MESLVRRLGDAEGMVSLESIARFLGPGLSQFVDTRDLGLSGDRSVSAGEVARMLGEAPQQKGRDAGQGFEWLLSAQSSEDTVSAERLAELLQQDVRDVEAVLRARNGTQQQEGPPAMTKENFAAWAERAMNPEQVKDEEEQREEEKEVEAEEPGEEGGEQTEAEEAKS